MTQHSQVHPNIGSSDWQRQIWDREQLSGEVGSVSSQPQFANPAGVSAQMNCSGAAQSEGSRNVSAQVQPT
jgi:hypothetical protein